jgi:hypothetical protein
MTDRALCLIQAMLLLSLVLGVTPAWASVELVSFEATLDGSQAVLVTWETASEVDMLGFFVQRSLQEEDGYERVSDLILATGDVVGASYEFIDTNVQGGMTYYYRLEAVDLSGASEFYDPVSVTLPALPTATPTPTPTSTPTATSTSTPTATPTDTPTSTPTPTLAPSDTPLPSDTPQPTPTPTLPATDTSTATPAATATVAATAAPTATAVPTATATPTVTTVVTATAAPVVTATMTATIASTATPAPTAIATPTATLSSTPSPAPTETLEPGPPPASEDEVYWPLVFCSVCGVLGGGGILLLAAVFGGILWRRWRYQ